MESLLTRDDAAHIICMARQERDRYRTLQASNRDSGWAYNRAKADALHDMAYDLLTYIRRALHKSPIKMI